MEYKQLWVLIEGSDDTRFIDKIIRPILINNYNSIKTWEYSKEPLQRKKKILKSIAAIGDDYLFFSDINNSPCVSKKMDVLKSNFKKTVNSNNIVVVIKEIESWYLAGLDNKKSKELSIKPLRNTNDITKEEFNRLIPKKFDSRIDFMVEILKRFSVETARRKNKSFNYLLTKIESL